MYRPHNGLYVCVGHKGLCTCVYAIGCFSVCCLAVSTGHKNVAQLSGPQPVTQQCPLVHKGGMAARSRQVAVTRSGCMIV